MGRQLFRNLAVLGCAAAIVSVLAGTAGAGSGGVSGLTVSYTAAAGEANFLFVQKIAPAHISMRELGTTLGGFPIQVSTTGGCTVTTVVFPNDTLDCPGISPGSTLSISVGDGNDRVLVDSGVDSGTNLIAIQIDGGAGDEIFLENDSSVSTTFVGGPGDDLIFGNGTDAISYASAPNAVDVNLRGLSASGDGTDTLFGVSAVVGSAYDDTVQGNTAANELDGSAGNDTISYSGASGVNVNLESGAATGDGNDVLSGFENVVGSTFSDGITGDGQNNVLDGGSGNDTISGLGGDDTLIGGPDGGVPGDTLNGDDGSDTADYSDGSGITVDLASGSFQVVGGGEGTDNLTAVENVAGSPGNDTIHGNAGANRIDGAGGDDTLTGGGGADILNGGDGNDTIGDGAGSGGGVYNGDAGADVLSGDASGTTRLNGGGDNDTLKGGSGNDLIDGNAGSNTADFSAGSAVIVDLQTGTATGNGADTLANVQNVTGSANGDTIRGDGNANTLNGGLGNDVLVGRSGDDSLIGGGDDDTASYTGSPGPIVADLGDGTATGEGFDALSGIDDITGSNYADTVTGDGGDNALSGGAGNDTLTGAGGNDTLSGGPATDTVDYSTSPSGVTVNLGAGTASGDGTDTLIGLENVTGSANGDTINAAQGTINVVTCGAGSDSVTADAFDNVAGDCESVGYPAPTVVTSPATGVTKQSATVHGTVNPNHVATTYHFEWGTTTSYGKTTPSAAAGSGTDPIAVFASITKLKPHTTYHYRLVATSSAGTGVGGDVTFTTS